MSQKWLLASLILAGVLFSVSYLYLANRFCPIEHSVQNLNWKLVPDLNENEKHQRAAYRYGRKKNPNAAVATPLHPSYSLTQKQDTNKEAQHGQPKGNVWLTKFFCDAKLSDLLIAVFTYGLFLATVWLVWATLKLWRAGEKQFRHARRSATIQSRDMKDSIAA